MPWVTPKNWTLPDGTPTHTQFNQDLITNPTTLRHMDDYSVKVYRSSAFSIPDGSRTPIPWNASQWEFPSNMWDSGANQTRLVAPVTGVYLLSAKVGWTPAANERRGVSYQINGIDPDYDMQFNSAQNGAIKQNGSDLILVEANDYVEVFAFQDSGGGALNILGSNAGSTSATFTLMGVPGNAPAWTPPRIWANGDKLTTSRLNTHVQDNLANLRSLNGHAGKVTLSENVTISPNERQVISWDIEQWSVGSSWIGSKYTAQVTGWYLLCATVEWRGQGSTTLGGKRGIGYMIDSRNLKHDMHVQSGTLLDVCSNGKSMVRMYKGESLEVYAYHTAEEALDINGDIDRTRAAIMLYAAA